MVQLKKKKRLCFQGRGWTPAWCKAVLLLQLWVVCGTGPGRHLCSPESRGQPRGRDAEDVTGWGRLGHSDHGCPGAPQCQRGPVASRGAAHGSWGSCSPGPTRAVFAAQASLWHVQFPTLFSLWLLSFSRLGELFKAINASFPCSRFFAGEGRRFPSTLYPQGSLAHAGISQIQFELLGSANWITSEVPAEPSTRLWLSSSNLY